MHWRRNVVEEFEMTVRETAVSQQNQPRTPIVSFGAFRLHMQPHRLCIGEETVRLGSRALDLLVALVQRAGEVISRAELESQVWPHSTVEDSSLRVHIAALRKALGDGVGEARYIANVPGRGYSFVAAVEVERPGYPSDPALVKAFSPRDLPVRLTSIIGRGEELTSLCSHLPQRRLVSIVGHGGMGKTALAIAVAHELRARYADGACFVDLAGLADGVLLPNAFAAALGISVFGESVMQTLDMWLRPRRMLIVIDNCEHLLESVTVLIDRILGLAPGIDVLATSREPLDACGEWVHRLMPLASPPADTDLTCQEALTYPALQLLAERAAASADTFALSQSNLDEACALCRRLDGVPLALEFAAARIGLLGVHGVVAQLDDRLRLLSSGRRTVLPRHRTLRALLDWSYELLPEHEQRVLRACGIFQGEFSLESALAVLSSETINEAQVRDAVLSLISKSLIVSDPGRIGVKFSLLEITRAYALELLSLDVEHSRIAERHARQMIVVMQQSEADWDCMPRTRWHDIYLHSMGNVRVALDWAFGAEGNAEIGVRLAGAMMLQMARFLGEDELRGAARRALQAIRTGIPADAKDTMRLHTILANTSAPGSGRAYDSGMRVPTAFAEALENGQRRARVDEQLEALYHLGALHFGGGNYPANRDAAQRILQLATQSGDESALLLGDRMGAQAAHFLGHHEQAIVLARKVLDRPHIALPLRIASPVDRAVSMRIVLARALWMQGLGEQADQVMQECLYLAARDMTPISLAQALCLGACPLALWRADNAAALTLSEGLVCHANQHGMEYFGTWGQHFLRVLAMRSDPAAAQPSNVFHPGLPMDSMQLDHIATMVPSLDLSAALGRCEQGLVGWSAPEIMRLHGDHLLSCGGHGEPYLTKALALAREQGALAWKLRCATSLARLWDRQSQSGAARELLAPIVASVREDRNSTDLRLAMATLDSAS